VGVAVSAPLTATTAAIAAPIIVLGHEAFAKKPFSDSGEGKKALNAVGKGADHLGHEIGKIMGW
jgi:hypothetical protein